MTCSPNPAKAVPTAEGWVHEVKFDGHRVQAHKVGLRVILFSRNGDDFSERFPSIVQELRDLPAKATVLDGEIVASDLDGRPNLTSPGCTCRTGVSPGQRVSTCGCSTF
jgi:bifunctional non-homologous end joining protein LigD